MAVNTNYFPLWEAEKGKFKLTRKINKPRPLKGLLEMMNKFAHLTDEEIVTLEKEVQERYKLIEGMTQIWPLEESPLTSKNW